MIFKKAKPPLITLLLKDKSLIISSFDSINPFGHYQSKRIALEKSELCNTIIFNQSAVYQPIADFKREFALGDSYFLIGVEIKEQKIFSVHHYFHYVLFALKYRMKCIEIVSIDQAFQVGLESYERLAKKDHQPTMINPDSSFLESFGLHIIGTQHYE